MVKKALYLSLLMLNASSLSHAWIQEEKDFFLNECGEIPVRASYEENRSVREIDPRLYGTPSLENPTFPIGTIRPFLRCILRNGEERVVQYPGSFNLRVGDGGWIRDSRQGYHEDVLRLPIGFDLNDQWQAVHFVERYIPHIPDTGHGLSPNRPLVCTYRGGNHFLGHQEQAQRFQRPGGLGAYNQLQRGDDNIYPPGHKNAPIYVEPFTRQGSIPNETLYGEYRFVRNLQVAQGREGGRLLYSDGNGNYYYPRTSQDYWQFVNGENIDIAVPDRIFFVASVEPGRSLNFVNGMRLPDNSPFVVHPRREMPSYLREGLYQILSSGINPQDRTRRLERWRKMESGQVTNDNNEFDITFPGPYLSSIPGMGGSAPRTIPVLRQNGLENIREEIGRISAQVERQRNAYPDAQQQVIFLGNTGVGKSTLLTGLFRDLTPVEGDLGFRLVCEYPLENINIGEGFGVGTLAPTAYYDENTQTLYWDSTGFQDARGEARDIINAFSIRKIFEIFQNTPSKIVFVDNAENLPLRDGSAFYRKLALLNELFPDQNHFIESLLFVFNNSLRHLNLERILGRILEEGNQNAIALSPPVIASLNFLRNNIQERTLFIESPRDEDYIFEGQDLSDRIMNTPNIPDLRLNLTPLVRGAGIHVDNLGGELRDHITDFVQHDVAQKLLHGCRQKIELHQGTAAELRASFGEVLVRLGQLQNAENRAAFLIQIEKLLGQENVPVSTTGLRRLFDQVDFINQLGRQLQNDFIRWGQTLLGASQNKITSLCHMAEHTLTPATDGNGNILTFQGPFIGVSDLVEICTTHNNDFTSVNIFAGCKFFFDENLTLHGKNVSIVSPMVHISQKCTLDLSGLDGKNGADGQAPGGDGQPGQPGGNGGNCTLFSNQVTGDPQNLTISANGGQGGDGGNGRQGADGADGVTERRDRVPPLGDPFHRRLRLEPTIHRTNLLEGYNYILVEGTPGIAGGRGGRAGRRSFGGYCGNFFSPILQNLPIIMNSARGLEGQNGVQGNGGRGGRNGRNRVFYYNFPLVDNGFQLNGNQARAGSYILYVTNPQPINEVIQNININYSNLRAAYQYVINEFNTLCPLGRREGLVAVTRAPDGQLGQGVHGTPQAPVAQTPINIDQIQEAYNAYYLEEAQNENAAPFLGFAPSFENNNNNPQQGD